MRKTSYIAIIFFILLCFSISPSLANPQMNISSWGKINYSPTSSSPIKILRQSFQHSDWSASKFASIADVYQGHYNALSIVPEFKSLRPDALAYVYFNAIIMRTSLPWFTTFQNNGWLLKDAGGNYVKHKNDATGYYIDFGHPDFHTWLGNWFKGYIDSYNCDGASIDNWFCWSAVWYVADRTAINPRTGNPWTDQEICDAFKALTIKVRDTLGSGMHVLANAVYNGNHFFGSHSSLHMDGILNGGLDGVMSEGWICTNYDASEWVSEDSWKKSIDFAIWLEDNWSQGKHFMFIHSERSFVSGNSFPSDMTEAQYQQFVTYGYASRLLTIKNLDTMASFFYYIEQDFPQSLFNINIGTPLESYHTLETSHVYARKFSGGMVLVNPTYNSYTVTTGSGYKNAVTGSSVSSTLTVQPHTGLILTKA